MQVFERSILVVEDDEAVRDTIKDMLVYSGFRVETRTTRRRSSSRGNGTALSYDSTRFLSRHTSPQTIEPMRSPARSRCPKLLLCDDRRKPAPIAIEDKRLERLSLTGAVLLRAKLFGQ